MSPRVQVEQIEATFHAQKGLAERALAQLSEEQFFRRLTGESNSVAIIVKHVAGNLRSRFTDFLTSDGEKEWRHRDTEFVIEDDTWSGVIERWEMGWRVLFEALGVLTDDDLGRRVSIRAEPHTVSQALLRQVSHYGYHVGQIVLLARMQVGGGWTSLSIAKGESDRFNRGMFGA